MKKTPELEPDISREYEAKFVGINNDELLARIAGLGGGSVQERTLMKRHTFDFPDTERRGEYIRVRDEGGRVTLSYKHKVDATLSGMREINLQVDDYGSAVNLITQLGMKPASYEENYRTTYLLNDATITLDEWPDLPPFIEIEASSEASVVEACRLLGLDIGQALFGDVGVVYRHVLGIDIGGMPIITFANSPLYQLSRRTESDLIYKRQSGEVTPFQTFLRHSDEKAQCARAVSQILAGAIFEGADIIDIGAGDGSLMRRALEAIPGCPGVNMTCLEPSEDHFGALIDANSAFPYYADTQVIKQKFQEFDTTRKYDFVIMSHVYAFGREEYPKQYRRALALLKDNGLMMLIMREVDDVYDFKIRFRSKLLGRGYKPKIIGEALEAIRDIANEGMNLSISLARSSGEVRIPMENDADMKAIVEFFMERKWDDIPKDIQDEIVVYLKERNGVLRTSDGIALIRKNE